MATAHAPDLTSLGESAATAVGAGVLLGGFVAGVIGMLLGWETGRRDKAIVSIGYVGGMLMWLAFAAERIVG